MRGINTGQYFNDPHPCRPIPGWKNSYLGGFVIYFGSFHQRELLLGCF